MDVHVRLCGLAPGANAPEPSQKFTLLGRACGQGVGGCALRVARKAICERHKVSFIVGFHPIITKPLRDDRFGDFGVIHLFHVLFGHARLFACGIHLGAFGDPILEVDNISLSFGGVKAITDTSFKVLTHEIKAIIGPNGAGKSSLLNCINGTLVSGKYFNNNTTSGNALFCRKPRLLKIMHSAYGSTIGETVAYMRWQVAIANSSVVISSQNWQAAFAPSFDEMMKWVSLLCCSAEFNHLLNDE